MRNTDRPIHPLCPDVWTSEIPPELVYIVQEDAIHPHPPGHVADCDIPGPPFVPRNLDESILNRKREEPRFEHVYRYVSGDAICDQGHRRVERRGTSPFTNSLNAPSHAVLNHLSTSSMQGEVVGMASTARYRAKVRVSARLNARSPLNEFFIVYDITLLQADVISDTQTSGYSSLYHSLAEPYICTKY